MNELTPRKSNNNETTDHLVVSSLEYNINGRPLQKSEVDVIVKDGHRAC